MTVKAARERVVVFRRRELEGGVADDVAPGHRVPLDEINEAIEMTKSGGAGRVVVRP